MLSEKIKFLRTEFGISQSALAKHLGLSQQAIAKWERGIAEPDSEMLSKMASYFNVSTDYLLGRTTDRNYANTSINSEWPPEAKVLFRDAHKLTPEQRDIVMKLIKEFIGESK